MGNMFFLALSTDSTGVSIKEFALIKMEKSNDLLEFFVHSWLQFQLIYGCFPYLVKTYLSLIKTLFNSPQILCDPTQCS